jgi:hypothetical protein
VLTRTWEERQEDGTMTVRVPDPEKKGGDNFFSYSMLSTILEQTLRFVMKPFFPASDCCGLFRGG